MAKVNFSISNSQVTNEIHNVASSATFTLIHDVFYNKAGKLLTIWTGAGGTGTQLTLGTDYNVGGIIPDGDLPLSITPDVAYSTLTISNAAYHSVDLYFNYYPLGDYVEAEDWEQLVTGIRLPTKSIASANQTTDLTVYCQGGASYSQDGTKIHVTWTGGDATYYHKFTVPAGWKIKSKFVDLAPGNGSSTFAWCGYGTGGLTLVKDEAHSQWIVETEGCFDVWTKIPSSYSWRKCEQYTNKTGVAHIYGASHTTNTLTAGIYCADVADAFVLPYVPKRLFSATMGGYNYGSAFYDISGKTLSLRVFRHDPGATASATGVFTFEIAD